MTPIADLHKPSARAFVARCLTEWAIITTSIATALAIDSWAVKILAVVIVGSRQHALGILGHDGAHYAASKKRWLNDLLTNALCFWPLGIGIYTYREFHFKHHRFTGTEDDPELRHKKWAAPKMDIPMTRSTLARQVVLDMFGGGIAELLYLIFDLRARSVADLIGPVLVIPTFIATCLYFQQPMILALWFGSMLTAFWAVFRLRIWTEHQGTSGTHRTSARIWQRLLFVPHNTWHHWEHHRWPGVPSWNLAKARLLATDEPLISIDDLYRSYQSMQRVASGAAIVSAQKTEEPVDQAAA